MISARSLVEDDLMKLDTNTLNDKKLTERLISKALRVWRREGTRGTVRLALIRLKR